MLFRVKQSSGSPLPLRPFVLRIREGFMVGMAMEPSKGSPCVGCVELWLRERHVEVERAQLADLKLRRDLLTDLISENKAHVFYEITHDGMHTRLDCAVFPHPDCDCRREEFLPPEKFSERTNLAFSPLTRVESTRFGTPEGNLWLTCASGEAPRSRRLLTVYGAGKEKAESRLEAVEEWMKRAAISDLTLRAGGGANFPAEILPTGKMETLTERVLDTTIGIPGVGTNRDEAAVDALFSLAKMRTLKSYASNMKNPMLIVGANNWLRTRVPFFLLQQYDLHPLFYPNSMPSWVVGIAAFSRVKVDEKPLFAFGASAEIGQAMDKALLKILELCRPDDLRMKEEVGDKEKVFELKTDLRSAQLSKLNLWWTHWIYRCPKISLKDVLHLEPYTRELSHWREYFRDGQERISVLTLNHPCLPSSIRHVVRLNVPETSQKSARNINGIGTWADFRDAFA